MFDMLSIKGGICAPAGFNADGIHAGLKPDGSPDCAFIFSELPCKVEAVFTKNRFQAAPITYYKKNVEGFDSNFVFINAKNANAMTGDEGEKDIEDIFHILKNKFTKAMNPIMSSTGVIGVRLPKDKLMKALIDFNYEAKNSSNAAQAIMTTDSYPKEIAFKVDLENGQSFSIGAIAKGAGMINPAMATMLCFITTDADVPKEHLGEILSECTETTFNAISVDGDTSTNDTVLVLANGYSGAYEREAFKHALKTIMHKLALDMVADGEGAQKLVAFEVKGAATKEEAQLASKKLSQSLLVKTAIFGEDPNWGRIASTIGASGVQCDWRTLSITFGDVLVYDQGQILFNKEVEAKAAKVMQTESFRITCDLGQGEESFTSYGCDLGHEYVKINADYRT